MATITAQDGTGDWTTPRVLDGFGGEAASANIVSDLLNGEIAVTLLGDKLRTGTLHLVYDDDALASAARVLLGRATWFTLTAPERPAVALTFVREGTLGVALHDEVRDVWVFDVGFQEVRP